MHDKRAISLNGKFLAAHMTGVHRVAWALIVEMDRLVGSEQDSPPWEIVLPRDARWPDELLHIRGRRAGIFTWQFWEQFDLPRLARGKLLVSLCNLAPIAADGVTLVHDAQVYLTPKSYGRAFRAWYRFALPWIGRSSRRIVTVSEYSRQQLVRFGIAPLDKISVVHNGVDHILDVSASHETVARLKLVPGRYVVALANVQAHKNIGVLFKAFETIRDLRLVLVGADDRDAFIRAGSTPPDNVVFAGRIDDAQLRGLFEQALCFACPSTTEGFGLPPLEAMLVGCPAVVAPCGALPEVCGDAALYADASRPDAWSNAFGQLLANVEQRKALAAAGVRQASRFTWSRAGRALFDIVQAAASARAQ